jgi:hypothetical protein
MNTRSVFILIVLLTLTGCSDADNDQPPPATDESPLPPSVKGTSSAGHYSGTMTLNFNDCEAISDDVGNPIPFSIEVINNRDLLNVILPDLTASSIRLNEEKRGMFVVKTGSVRHVYTLDFSDEDSITGTCDVFESETSATDAMACASYDLDLNKDVYCSRKLDTVHCSDMK